MKNKKDLIKEVRELIGTDIKLSAVELVVDSFIARLTESIVAKEDVNIPGLGIFTKYHRKGRNCRNPINGGLMFVPGRDLPKLRFSKAILNKIKDD